MSRSLPVMETTDLVCDPGRKYVRITERRTDGLVAFEFAIGWPELCVELLLPLAAFDAFCKAQRVQFLPPGDAGSAMDTTEETDA